MTKVEGRTAFITGGANGIGLGIARAFAKAGARIALADMDEAALGRAKEELSKVTETETVVLDVRDRKAFAKAADRIEETLGPVSLLFNNAGVAGGARVDMLTYELWDWTLGVNIDGVVNGVQTFMPRMIKRGEGGHIVNTASGAGLAITGSGVLYHTSKYAVVGMAEALQVELQPFSIGVSVLCPGPVATDIIARSAAAQPKTGATLSEKEQKAADERMEFVKSILRQSITPDAVGELVLDAVKNGKLHIHTDRMMIPYIEKRTEALLQAVPAA